MNPSYCMCKLFVIWISVNGFLCVSGLFCVLMLVNMSVLGLTQRENLPKKDAVRPHVAQGGIQIMENTFWCHPLQGQEGLDERN